MTEFTSTNLSQILYHVICVLLSYNLCQIYANTEAGEKYAGKTLRQQRRKQARSHEVSILVYSGDSYALLNAKFFIGFLLDQPKEIQSKLRSFFPEEVVPVKEGFT